MTQGKHILLADDEAAFRFSAGVALRMAGYQVTEAGDGLIALAELVRLKEEGRSVSLVVSDLRMPNLSGAELVAALRRHDDPVPVLVVSGYCDEAALRAFGLAGYVEFMEKPLQPEELLDRIENILASTAA